jgi:two-component system, NtrC family, response regulator AtoC
MQRETCETKSLLLLAGFDFLDLCLLGETGTGKTHTARLIHRLSPRASKSFISVNCAELTPSIIESELFGYEKGAFTGAITTKIGKFEAADGGTLFLDEIGELPVNLQAKLLKVVEEKSVTRVGGNRPHKVDVRIIYATHRELNTLREDLRYRIAAHSIHLKPLRERTEEIIPLARLFLQDFSNKSGRKVIAGDDVLRLLENAEWRGNVRELRSFVEKVCLEELFDVEENQSNANEIELTSTSLLKKLAKNFRIANPAESFKMPSNLSPLKSGENMEKYLEKIETHLLKTALDTHNNNQTRAARELGISRSGLIKKLKRFCHY